jgi:hypothetical protein
MTLATAIRLEVVDKLRRVLSNVPHVNRLPTFAKKEKAIEHLEKFGRWLMNPKRR